jgi:hypothetical protein
MEWPVLAFLGLLVIGAVVLLLTRRATVVSPPATMAVDPQTATSAVAEEAHLEYPGSTQIEGDHLEMHLSGVADPSPDEVKNARFTDARPRTCGRGTGTG